MTATKRTHVFLCHALEDKSAVRKVYDRLTKDGFDAWLDEEKLLPGQDWELEISKAIKASEAIIVFLSSQSVRKAGFIQKEIKLALDVAREKPEETIFLIPARFDECEVPDSLHHYQWVNLFDDKGYERIRKALETRFGSPEIEPLTHSEEDTISNPKLAQVTIIIEKDILKFTEREKVGFVFAISKLTGVSSNQIRILQVTEGSVVISLEMQEIVSKRLMELYFNNDIEIQRLGISKISLKLDPDEKKELLTGENRLNVLFLTADPTDTSRLRLGQEAREIREKLQLSKYRDRFAFNERWSVRPVDISQAMLDLQPQIVHFSGHGTPSGAICFEDQVGKMQPVNPEALSALFEQFSDQVVVVVLNACYSEQQAKAISEKVSYVIGMNKGISDMASIAFSIGFYQAIGAGRNVADAYKLGVTQIRLQGIEDHEIPVLVEKTT